MTVSLYKFKCQLNEDGTIDCKLKLHNNNLYVKILEALGNEPAEFPLQFYVLFDKQDRWSNVSINNAAPHEKVQGHHSKGVYFIGKTKQTS